MRLCTVPGCGRKHHGKGYCLSHYHQWRRAGYPDNWKPRRMKRRCIVTHCQNKHRANGYCNPHYRQWVKRGKPANWRPSPDLIANHHNWERSRQVALRNIPAIIIHKPMCGIHGCDQEPEGHGYCSEHYQILVQYNGLADWTLVIRQHFCKYPGCSNPARVNGLCIRCYRRWEARGKPHPWRICKIPGCLNKHRAKGFCKKHYQDWVEGRLPSFPPPPRDQCQAPGCNDPVRARGRCFKHYQRWREKQKAAKTAA